MLLLLVSSIVAFSLYSYSASTSLSSPSDNSLRSQTEINVVFEEAHLPISTLVTQCGSPGEYSGFANYLAENGYTVSTIDLGTVINSSVLSPIDVLIIVAPQQDYDPSELDAIETWVKNGGSLLLISEENCLGSVTSTIAERFGIQYARSTLIDLDDKVNCEEAYFYLDGGNIGDHEITSNVSRVEVYAADGIISYPCDATLLLVMDEDETAKWADCTPAEGVPLMIAMESGNVDAGKLVTITDSTLWRNDTDTDGDGQANFWDSDNEILALDTINWLVPYIPENVPPSVPVLYDPGDVDEDGNFIVDWSDSSDPDGVVSYYELQMATDSGFTNVVQTWTPTVSEQAVTGLGEGDYYFHVRAVDDDDAPSGWSNVVDMLVELPNNPPSTPTLYDPGDTDDNGEFTVDWSDSTDPDPGGYIDHYELQMSNVSDFSTILQTWAPTESQQYISELGEDTYFFRVRARDNEGAYSSWSNVENITVEFLPIPQAIDGEEGTSLLVWSIAFLIIIGLGVGIAFGIRKYK